MFTTTHKPTASYLFKHGFRPARIESDNFPFTLVFDGDDETLRKLAFEYSSSEERKFFDCFEEISRQIKDVREKRGVIANKNYEHLYR